jgi:hypothetical protein
MNGRSCGAGRLTAASDIGLLMVAPRRRSCNSYHQDEVLFETEGRYAF